MFVESTLESLLNRYPKELNEAVKNFRSGKSKRKDDPLKNFTWGFDYSVSVRGFSGQELLDGTMQDEIQTETQRTRELSIDQRVEEYCNKCNVTIVGKVGQRSLIQSEIIGSVPSEIADRYKAILEEELKEKVRFESMTEEERNAEMDELVRKMIKSPGFIKLKYPKRQ